MIQWLPWKYSSLSKTNVMMKLAYRPFGSSADTNNIYESYPLRITKKGSETN